MTVVSLSEREPVSASFTASVLGQASNPMGEMTLRLSVPFDQVPNAMRLLRYVGGTMFEWTVREVSFGEGPASEWDDADQR